MAERRLTMKQELFIREYCIDFNGTRAAIAAGYSSTGADVEACRLLADARIHSRVELIKAQRCSKVELSIDDVVRDIRTIMRADPRELIETRVGACRYCWGDQHQYQRTPQEFRDYFEDHMKEHPDQDVPFDAQGGDGYRRFRDPHPDCPECEGVGQSHVILKDTSKLSGDAVALYAGVKQTANGVEVLMQSKDKAREQAAKYLGMNKETVLVGDAPSGLTHFYPSEDGE